MSDLNVERGVRAQDGADAEDDNLAHARRPVLAMIALGVAVYLSAVNSVPLTGGVTTTAVVLQVVMWGVFASGLAVASYCRARKPDTDARIGRQRRGSRGD